MPAPRTSVRWNGDMGEAAVQGCREILTDSHCHCPSFSAVVVPLPSAQLPRGASQAACWLLSPLQRPLHAPGRLASKLPGSPQGMKHRWVSWAVKWCSQVPPLSQVSAQSNMPLGKRPSSEVCFNFQSKGIIGWVPCVTLKAIHCLLMPQKCPFLAQSVLCSPKP